MKLSRKLIPALAMLLVSAVMMTTASFAWFSINIESEVKGMTVKTTATDSVLVADSTLDATALATDFATDLEDSMEATLHPVSTVNGTTFFYVEKTDVDADGKIKDDKTYAAYTDGAFSEYNAEPFCDYVFQVKASNAGSAEKYVRISALDLIYNGEGTDTQKAFRVAVFAEKRTGDAFTATKGDLMTILKPSGAMNNSGADKAVADVADVGTISDVLQKNAGATLGTVGAGKTEYFKVVVRIWLEGEDTTCTNDVFVGLDEESGWSLALTVKLDAEATGVTNIGSGS